MLHPMFAGDLPAYGQKQRASRCSLAMTFAGAVLSPGVGVIVCKYQGYLALIADLKEPNRPIVAYGLFEHRVNIYTNL